MLNIYLIGLHRGQRWSHVTSIYCLHGSATSFIFYFLINILQFAHRRGKYQVEFFSYQIHGFKSLKHSSKIKFVLSKLRTTNAVFPRNAILNSTCSMLRVIVQSLQSLAVEPHRGPKKISITLKTPSANQFSVRVAVRPNAVLVYITAHQYTLRTPIHWLIRTSVLFPAAACCLLSNLVKNQH